jgi:hypothetical protein
VHNASGSTRREIDWVLISHDTPCSSAIRHLLPGLCTHLALQVDITLSIAALRPIDPCGRRFLFNRANPDRLNHAGQCLALVLWWASTAGMSPDACIRYAHSRVGVRPPSPSSSSFRTTHSPKGPSSSHFFCTLTSQKKK